MSGWSRRATKQIEAETDLKKPSKVVKPRREHVTGKDCWCHPTVHLVEGKPSTVVHRT